MTVVFVCLCLTGVSTDFTAWLESLGLARYAADLASLGFDNFSSVFFVEERDLDDIKMARGHKRYAPVVISALSVSFCCCVRAGRRGCRGF